MKRILPSIVALSFAFFAGNVNAQNSKAPKKCYAVESMNQDFQKHPELAIKYQEQQKSRRNFYNILVFFLLLYFLPFLYIYYCI